MRAEHFDVVVVGAGSSGGVVASRLSEDDGRRVLLLEAGPDFPDEQQLPPSFVVGGGQHWIPAGLPELDWGYWNETLPSGHRVRLARGRLVGGSSMVNGTVAVRAAPFDFDRWAGMGNPGWAWADVLDAHRRLEHDLDFGDRDYHGGNGPIRIRRMPERAWEPVHHAFVEACLELGMRFEADLNHPDASVGAVGPWPHSRIDEARQGTLVTYIRAARGRPNFTLRADALADRVLVEAGRASGVRYLDAAGRPHEVAADLVVVCCGAYSTPPLLQRSGIGPAGELRALGLEPVADLPVGENLLDHPNCAFLIHSSELAIRTGRLFQTNARGPLEQGGEPGWQLFPVPIEELAGLTSVIVALNRQDALGRVIIRSADPTEHPSIDHRYNSQASDLARFERAFAFVRELIARPAFRRQGARHVDAHRTTAEIVATGLGTAQHPVGSCRMGPADDPRSVVDARLGVHGVEGLMVADSSIFPDNVMNNTNLTCYAIGEIASDIVRGRR